MIVRMKFLVALLLFFTSATASHAAFLYEQEVPSEVLELESIQGETIYGRLDNGPHTFTFAVTEDTQLSVQVSMKPGTKKDDVSLILVKEETRGVSEVGRVDAKKVSWKKKYSIWKATSFLFGEKIEYSLDPGIYKLEVSSPENNKGYRLELGKGDGSLYKELFIVRNVFDIGRWGVIFSPLFFVPILLIVGIVIHRKRKRYVS